MRLFLTLFVCFLLSTIYAQKLDHRLGYVIIQVEKKEWLPDIISEHSSRFRADIKVEKRLSTPLGIYLLAFDYNRIHEGELLTGLRLDKKVQIAQFDHFTTNRSVPDDPLFADQWQWLNVGQTGGLINADIDADHAWDITTGGVTAKGDTIVVAIIDDGLNYLHPDIAANTWINHGEIPDNGLDDDENGYIDDVYGWNVYSESPDVLNQGHGLSVAGMIGAVGNNAIGITGINWHVKLMTIVGGTPESAVISSYSYALEQRLLYHETNGEKGAFVVSTNSSWGIDYGQPADAPIWCAFYDSLGLHGILSAAATANNPDNIDTVGDLPTACVSEFLLSVTALNHNNERTFSAFGLEHVDFGAPGEDIFTTEGSDEYGTTSGTSFASPVAAGLVALLYSAPCLGVAELAHSNPAAGARYIRDLIFNGVEKLSALENETKFGGALNAGNSMTLLMSLCSECPIPLGINSNVISDTEVILSWVTTDTADAINARYKPVSTTDWDTIFDISEPLTLTHLTGCTEYIIEFESICADTSTGFQVSHEFKTEGCCEIPASINLITDETSLNATWSHVFAAEYYLIQWRVAGDIEWMEVVTSLDEIQIEDLLPCTFYEFRLQTNCDTSVTGFSDIFSARTRNCGNCLDLSYCEVGSEDSSEEFLDSLSIGPLVNHTGNNGGYIFFEDLNPEFTAGQTYPVFLRPGFGQPEKFDEQFRIWLDANQNGVFEADELLLDTTLLEEDTLILSEITIPPLARSGSTRMRVSMAYFDPPFVVDQDPCGFINFGEVEDYCVIISRNENTCPRVDTVFFDAINMTSAFMYWPGAEEAIVYTYRFREVGETDYMGETGTLDTTAFLSGLTKCTMYEIQIRTVCMEDTAGYDVNYILKTECDVAVKDVDLLLTSFEVYPNPVTDHAFIKLQPKESGEHNISVFNMQGQRIHVEKIYADQNYSSEVQLDAIERYPSGLYFIVVEKDGLTATKKLVKM